MGLYFAGAGVLLALAGCGRSFMSGERAPWRHQAEISCLKSGAVKVGAGVVQIEPIEGPGMCGADFPLKVAALGESSPAISYSDDLRPPGSIPTNSTQMPRWPINEPAMRHLLPFRRPMSDLANAIFTTAANDWVPGRHRSNVGPSQWRRYRYTLRAQAGNAQRSSC